MIKWIKGSKENIDVSRINQLGTVIIGRNEEIIDCTTLGDEPVIHANSKEENRILKRVFGRDWENERNYFIHFQIRKRYC